MESAALSVLVQQLRAAGEVTRARILALLAHGELSVGELAQVLNQSQPRLSRHLKFLTGAGLIERLPEGAWVFYRLPVEGRARALVDTLNAAIDPDDADIRRDRVRLGEVKGERAEAAGQYFSRVADDWDKLRALHYSEAEIEKAVLNAAGAGPFDLVIDFGTGTGRMLALFAGKARDAGGHCLKPIVVQPERQAPIDCRCGRPVFFRNSACLACGAELGFDPELRELLPLEAVEGTDALIARAAGLKQAESGGVLVKVKKPGQERRVDLPAIGVMTVKAVAHAGFAGIAIEAGGALMLDREAAIAEADALGVFIYGINLTI